MSRPPIGRRADYFHFHTITTRWMDNDIYGHVNNVVYYSYIDTVIADFLMNEGGLSPWNHDIVGMAVENGCRFHKSIAYPDIVHAGIRVAHLGNSSVRYEIGIFANDDHEAAAEGHFVHVFVKRSDQRPTKIPDPIREALASIILNKD
jgi:acyl-CoA thioester hydrolase